MCGCWLVPGFLCMGHISRARGWAHDYTMRQGPGVRSLVPPPQTFASESVVSGRCTLHNTELTRPFFFFLQRFPWQGATSSVHLRYPHTQKRTCAP
ncbi:hypothetical protein EDB92DRAFT_1891142, partial [Lactarius akahatsu]